MGRSIGKWIFVLLACAAISAAPLTACACSHHQVEFKQAPSCHGHAEEPAIPMADEGTANDANCVDESCVCAVREPAAAIKAEKRSANVDLSVDTPKAADAPTKAAVIEFASRPRVTSLQLNYKTAALRGLLPSRAPPRL